MLLMQITENSMPSIKLKEIQVYTNKAK